ncbi:MAG TPA: hypothetical protein DD706_19405 [Nitrospiraceae bacterium]|nr:hypothetical protein [Nitrospiraceae bacterium]
MITKIISGGQTGADRGGLDAAIYCHISLVAGVPRDAKPKTVPYRWTIIYWKWKRQNTWPEPKPM